MLRIHFTPQDLLRIRVAESADPMWEIALSLAHLRSRSGVIAFDAWRRHARANMDPSVRMLLALTSSRGHVTDTSTPGTTARGLDPDSNVVQASPPARVCEKLHILAAGRSLPPAARSLLTADSTATTRLSHALRTYHRRALAPHWSMITAHIDADRAMRMRVLLDGGGEALLNSLRPTMRWTYPVLETDYPVDQDLHLKGRGLRLVPSFFCWRTPVTLFNGDLPPVLVYPVERDPRQRRSAKPGNGSLDALIGRTRANALRAIDSGCTTSELARRVGTSVASASQHAAILREAGLITTRRRGRAVLHARTPLGTALLHAD